MMFFLREMDRNRNGQLEEDELEDRRGYFARRILERTGVKPEFPLHLSRVEEALQRAYASRADGAGEGTSAASSAAQSSSGAESRQPSAADAGSSSSREPLVAGFGTKAEQPSVPGFGAPAPGSSPSLGSTGRFATAPATEERRSEGQRSEGQRSEDRELEERYRSYAEGLMRQYDRNRNGRLERDEWREMRGDPERADQNHDGVITREELTARLMEFARRGPSAEGGGDSRGSSSRDSSDRRGDRNRDRDDNQPRLRFLTVLERLPEGLPDWFYEKDSDLDGQVSMSEFTTDWTEAKVEEFFQYDLNRDGIITPEECLAALEAEKN